MNTRIEYLYRSGGNYKWTAEIILPGLPSARMGVYEAALRGTCETDDRFIASQVALPPCFPWVTGEAPYDDEEDHCYHEFGRAEETEQPPTMMIAPDELLELFKTARKQGWRAFDPAEQIEQGVRI